MRLILYVHQHNFKVNNLFVRMYIFMSVALMKLYTGILIATVVCVQCIDSLNLKVLNRHLSL